MNEAKARIAVLVSGGGTNLQAILDAAKRGELPSGEIALVISDRAGAYALRAARHHRAAGAAGPGPDAGAHIREHGPARPRAGAALPHVLLRHRSRRRGVQGVVRRQVREAHGPPDGRPNPQDNGKVRRRRWKAPR